MTQQPKTPWTVSVASPPGSPPAPGLLQLDRAIRKGREPRDDGMLPFRLAQSMDFMYRCLTAPLPPVPERFTGFPVDSQCNEAELNRYLVPMLACGTVERGLIVPTGTFAASVGAEPARGIWPQSVIFGRPVALTRRDP